MVQFWVWQTVSHNDGAATVLSGLCLPMHMPLPALLAHTPVGLLVAGCRYELPAGQKATSIMHWEALMIQHVCADNGIPVVKHKESLDDLSWYLLGNLPKVEDL